MIFANETLINIVFLTIFIIVEFCVLRLLFFKVIPFLRNLGSQFIFERLVSEKQIAIHEAGHTLFYLKSIKTRNSQRFNKHLNKLNFVCCSVHGGCNSFQKFDKIDHNSKFLIYIGGIVLNYKLNEHLDKIPKYKFLFDYLFRGNKSDIDYLKYHFSLTLENVREITESYLNKLTPEDIDFVVRFSDILLKEELKPHKNIRCDMRLIENAQLRTILNEYKDRIKPFE